VNAFDGAGVGKRVFHFAAAGFGGCDAESGAKAFAACEKGVAHRFVDGGGLDAFGGEGFVEGAIDGGAGAFEVGADVEGLGVTCACASCGS
jgi:hypothetical protein